MFSQEGHPVGVFHPQLGAEHSSGVGGGIFIEGVPEMAYDLLL